MNAPTPAFDWSDYLKVAKRLIEGAATSTTPEADYRCVVSRSYYAGFNLLMAHAQAHLGYQPVNRSDDHGKLRQHLKAKGHHELSQTLKSLVEMRAICDYESFVQNPALKATLAVKGVESIIAKLAAMQGKRG